MYSYQGLEKLLKIKGLTKTDLSKVIGIFSRTIAKISKVERISLKVLNKIASFLSCDVNGLYREISENIILQTLRDEKEFKISGGLYHELQIRMTFNSNHIEGSELDEEQTRMIFETRAIGNSDVISIDDIIETSNHFRCIDYCIDVAEKPLTEEIIKHIHPLLKQGTKDSFIGWFNVGDYKKRVNIVRGKETCNPNDVPVEMKRLIDEYNSKTKITFEDIVAFHHDFEDIHPFQDGNERVGRLIAFEECLRFNIIPFIIEDSKKGFYYRGLKNWSEDKGWLLDTCLDGQDAFKRMLKMLNIQF